VAKTGKRPDPFVEIGEFATAAILKKQAGGGVGIFAAAHFTRRL
jgi:hypothetical protein